MSVNKDPFLIKEKFIKFLEKEIPSIISSFEPREKHVLIDIFQIEPESKSKIDIGPNISKTDLGFEWTTVARVMCSTDCEYKQGEVVHLWDYKVATFSGTDYEQWCSLSEKGSVKRIGAAPPMRTTKFYDSFMRFVFNPFPIISKKHDLNLFLIPEHEIAGRIKNPHDLVNH